jgi:MSHA pilin protein MshA
MKNATQRGFTLIELVVVIVILGILAAFALPRFMGLEVRARQASMRALEGSVRTAAAMAHAAWLANGTAGAAGNLNIEGQTVTFANNYPNAATIQRTLQPGTIQAGVPGRFTATVSGTRVTFNMVGANDATRCFVRYDEAVNATTPPAIPAATVTGC